MSKSASLIITADDYGLNNAVNQGTLAGVRKGVVSSVHVMVNLVTKEAMEELIDAVNTPGIDCGIGLHLNTTWGKSVIQEDNSLTILRRNKFLDPDKDSYYFKDLYEYEHLRTRYKDVTREFEAQYELLIKYLGKHHKIDAISSHFNIHFWDKRFIKSLMTVLGGEKIPARSPLRWVSKGQNPQPPYYYEKANGEAPLRKTGIMTGLKNLNEPFTLNLLKTPLFPDKLKKLKGLLNDEYGLKTPVNASGHWFGQPEWKAMDWFMDKLVHLNAHSPGYCSEVFMHLANNDKGYREKYDYPMDQRFKEFETISSTAFINNFQAKKDELGIRHGSYRSVLNA